MELLGNQVINKISKDALRHVPDALSRMYEPDMEAVNSIDETNNPWNFRRVANVREMPMQFHERKIEGERLYCHRPNILKVLPTELRRKAL